MAGIFSCCKDCSIEKRNLIREETGHDCHMTCEIYIQEKDKYKKIKEQQKIYLTVSKARQHLDK